MCFTLYGPRQAHLKTSEDFSLLTAPPAPYNAARPSCRDLSWVSEQNDNTAAHLL
jgi:hypothetical protein